MTQSHPPSPTSPSFSNPALSSSSSLNRTLSSRTHRSRHLVGNNIASSSSLVRTDSPKGRNVTGNSLAGSSNLIRTDSPKGFERSAFKADNGVEIGEPLGRHYSGVSRQESFEPNASQMSLYEFRRSSLKFHWENSADSYKDFGVNDWWPLEHVAMLGNRNGSRARVWASKVTTSKHGFTDTVADKIVRHGTKEEKAAALKEVENLKKLCHDHIVAFLGYYTRGSNLGILMFPVAAWDLDQFLQFDSIVEKRREMIKPWFGCLTRTLLFLHQRRMPFKHRDIKPANILIDRSGTVFLTDFGISNEYPSHQATITRGDGRFTVKYASPLMVDARSDQGMESDIFSLGCVFLEMITVLLGKELEHMYEYILDRTGHDDIEYHRDFEQFSMWATVLERFIQTQNSPSWKSYLVQQGLPIILRMVKESCRTDMGVDLKEICRTFDAISHGCKSCRNKDCAGYSPEKSLTVLGKETSEMSQNKKRITGMETSMANQLSVSVLSNGHDATESSILEQCSSHLEGVDKPPTVPQTSVVPSGAVLHNSTASQIEAIFSPSIVLQRQASDLATHDHPAQPISATAPQQQLESIEEGVFHIANNSATRPVTSHFLTASLDSSTLKTMSSTEPTRPQRSVAPSPIIEEIEQFPPTILHMATDPISISSTNSRIRLVDSRRKKKRIKSFDNANNIPGTEVLRFNVIERRWEAIPKTELRLQEGCLWRLPRGIKVKYRTPEGYFRPWSLSATKNMKRMFGRSMLTMFIQGRITATELQAFCSHEDNEEQLSKKEIGGLY